MAGMHTGHRLAVLLVTLLFVSAPLPAQAPASDEADAAVRGRIEAFFAALASGDPDTFEAMARVHATPGFLERRPAAQRAEMVRRLRADFGTMTLVRTRATPAGIVLDVAGSSGLQGRATLVLEEAPPRRIDRFGIEVDAGGGGNDGPAIPPPPVTPSMSDVQLQPALGEWLTAQTSAGEFSGVVLVARGNRTAFLQGFGEADRSAHVANSPDVRFNIGSINKSFTHVAVLQLMAAGKLKPTDTLGALLPDYPNPEARAATVQQLLDHRGGIADFFGPRYAATPKDQLQSNRDYLALVAPQPLTFAPGTRRQYCNGCYIVLGEIVARVSGQSYEAYVAEHVFGRAGMRRTGFLGAMPRAADVARGYTRRGVDGPEPQDNAGMLGARGSAAGGAYSTASDLLTYVDALRTHRLLSQADSATLLGGDGSSPSMAIAGGAPGLNALVTAKGDTVVVVLANMDPPHGERLGEALARQLAP